MTIENISDTARWVAVYRAMESERPDALFHDPFARRLAGPRGEEIVKGMKWARQMAWSMIVRTALFDQVVLDRVREGTDLVVNLAAGLDARPWRLPLPSSLRWVDVDLPGILEHKSEVMDGETPRCQYEAVATDLQDRETRRALLDGLASGRTNALVVSEGLLIYLPPAEVDQLARDLHAVPSLRWWVFDLGSPRVARMMNRWWGKSLARRDVHFQFAPQEGTAFFEPAGWRELEFHSTWDAAKRLKRGMRLMWLWNLLARLSSAKRREEIRRYSATVLLERM